MNGCAQGAGRSCGEARGAEPPPTGAPGAPERRQGGGVTPDEKARRRRAGGPRDAPRGAGRARAWVRSPEAGAEGRTEAPAPFLEKSPQIPARGDRLDVTVSRLGARAPSRSSPRHRRHSAPPTPARFPLGFEPTPHSHPSRIGPLRTSHRARRRQPPSSRARARLSPAPKGRAHVTARLQTGAWTGLFVT